MTIETLLAVVAIVLVSGVIGFMLANTWKGRAVVRQRLPLETMLDAVKEELLKADQKAREQGSALMRFESCEFEFAIETEVDASGKVTVWALELSAGARQTETNRIRIKYAGLPDQPLDAVRPPRN